MEKFIPMVTKNCVRRIPLDDVVYIMKERRKIKIVTDTGSYEYYEKLEHVTQHLDQRFYACLRTLVINLEKVASIEEQTVFFQNGDEFSMGRDNYVRARQYYSAYLKNLYKN